MTKEQAVAHFGTQAELARALGIDRASVCLWTEIPPLRQLQIEHITKRALRADVGIANPRMAGANA
jgi:hypothetical protein